MKYLIYYFIESSFLVNDLGDLCDPEGFTAASFDLFNEALLNRNYNVQSIDELRDYVSNVASILRNGLKRLDLDLSAVALPNLHGGSLNKALLRIVFSGCVGTTAYLPNDNKNLYVAQVNKLVMLI